MRSENYVKSALALLVFSFGAQGAAQDKTLPPIAVPPPKVGDPIDKTPPPVDPDMVVPAPKISPPPAVKPLGERVFCSSVSLADAMSQCEEYTAREKGECKDIGPSPKCRFQVKVIPLMETLNQPK